MNCEKYSSSATHDTEKHQHQQHKPAAHQRPYSNGNNDTNENGHDQPTMQLSRKEKLDLYLARNAAMQQRKSTSTSSLSSGRVSVGGDNLPANHHDREVATGCGVSRPPLVRNNHPGGATGGVDASGATALAGVASAGEAAPRRLSTKEREEDLKARLAAYQKRKSLAAAARSGTTCAKSAAVVPQEKENDDRAHQEVCR